MYKKPLLRVGVAVCGIALVAGCGSSTKTAPKAGAGSSSTPAPSPTASPASKPELQKLVLQAADLPAGWKGTAYKADPTAAANQAAVVKCVGVRNTDSAKVAEAHSEEFALGNASASSSAVSYKSQGDVDSDVAMLASPKLSTCYEQLVKKQLATGLPPGAKIESATVKFTKGSNGGPANIVATGTAAIKVVVSGQPVAVYVSIAQITGPMIEAEVSVTSLGAPAPAAVVKSLVTTVANRVGKA